MIEGELECLSVDPWKCDARRVRQSRRYDPQDRCVRQVGHEGLFELLSHARHACVGFGEFRHRDGNRGGKCRGEDRRLGTWSKPQLLESAEVMRRDFGGMA